MDPREIVTGAQDALTVRRVFGEPITVDGLTIIPAARVAGGGGGGEKGSQERGAGFGITARPAGVFVVRNGDARWRPAIDVNRVIMGGQAIAIAAILVLGPIVGRWMLGRTLKTLKSEV